MGSPERVFEFMMEYRWTRPAYSELVGRSLINHDKEFIDWFANRRPYTLVAKTNKILLEAV
jgi:hypothetical protein